LKGLSSTPVFKPCYNSIVRNKFAWTVLHNCLNNILSASNEVVRYFLVGYIDGDGCVQLNIKYPKITFCTYDFIHAQLIRTCLVRIGILPSKWNGRSIEITGSRAYKLADLLKGCGGIKSYIYAVNNAIFDRHSGFYISKFLKQERIRLGISYKNIPYSSNVQWRAENGRCMSERHLRQFVAVSGSKPLGDLLGVPLRWVSIQALTLIDETFVYDLACDGVDTHNFIANGLLTHNSVVWLDEIEKALAGAGSSGTTDSGVTARVVGTILTWRQETKASVFFVATANDVHRLPPEMYRRGRFDEVWFVDLPREAERAEIFAIHLSKRGRDPAQFKIEVLAKGTDKYTGAEIEAAIEEALIGAFFEKREVTSRDLAIAVKCIRPQFGGDSFHQVEDLRAFVGRFARPVSLAVDTPNKNKVRKVKGIVSIAPEATGPRPN
jgi:hypothetical protein